MGVRRKRQIGVHVRPILALDMTRPLADVEFTAAPARRVDTRDPDHVLRTALRTASALLASEQLGRPVVLRHHTGICEGPQAVRPTDRLLPGHQTPIGRPVAGGQLGGAAARYAADTIARDDDAGIAAHVAASYCGDTAVRAAEECVQLHGGIGMTWSTRRTCGLKRAKADQIALGDGYGHRARLAELVGLPPN